MINAHSHLLPEPQQIPTAIREQGFFWIDEQRQFMHQKNWKRPITDPSFFLEAKLDWMAQHHISHQVVLTLSQLYCNGLSQPDTQSIIRFQNDFHGQLQADYPQFIPGFVVQPAFIDQALAEIEYCVTQHQLSLLCLPTHFLNQKQQWISVADPSVNPIYELANEHHLAIEIHPYDAEQMVKLDNQFWRFHLVWMLAQVADTFLFYCLHNIPEKYPNIRTCFAHGAMLAQANYGRVLQGMKGRQDLFPQCDSNQLMINHPRIFFDTLVHDLDTFELLHKRAGTEQLLFGVDDPYPLGEMETVPGCYPGQLLDQAIATEVISTVDKNKICGNNILRWLKKTTEEIAPQ